MLYSAVFVIDNSATQGSDATSVVPLSACPTIPLPHHSLFPPPYPPSSAAHFAQSWGNVSPLAATLIWTPLPSVVNKRLTVELSPLAATLTKNAGGGVSNSPARLSFQAGTCYRLSPAPALYPSRRRVYYPLAASSDSSVVPVPCSQSPIP